jgi:universal stress protein A
MNTTQRTIFEERMPISAWERPHSSFPFLVERILVPIDFSELSKKALHYAIALARSAGASLIVLNVVRTGKHRYEPELISSPQFEAGKWRKLDERERQLVDFCRREIGRDPKSEAIIQIGKPAREIINTAKARYVDLIIMATHGVKGMNRILKSSTAQQVVGEAPCPVLVVSEQEHELIPA